MSQIEFKRKEKQIVETEVKESYPFVYTIIKNNFEQAICSAGQTFSKQMFRHGENKYVQSYTEVAEPTITERSEVTLNKDERFTLPVTFPSLMSWVCCESDEFIVYINENEIPCHKQGIVIYPSWIGGVQVEATATGQIIMHGSLSVPLKHKQ
tara:strand:+ start:5216 stop:5674 length:459 start_codon:yes stop_codon:yes gene_type:complete